MEVNEVKVADNEEVRKGVIVAYQEVMNKLKLMKDEHAEAHQAGEHGAENVVNMDGVAIENHDDALVTPLNYDNEDSAIQDAVIELASRESVDELAKNLTELRFFVTKCLDDIKIKLTAEYEKFYTLRQAIAYSKDELSNLYDIKVNVNTLSILLMTQRERESAFEKELSERKQALENERIQTEKERFREHNEYTQKRDAIRKREQEHYEMEKRSLYHDLLDKRRELEEAFETREASLAAREMEHQQLKEREARILAREQEFAQLKEKEMRYPEELRSAVHKAETTVADQLTRKYEYENKLAQIERESERKLEQQKITALEQQIEQYKKLKELFN